MWKFGNAVLACIAQAGPLGPTLASTPLPTHSRAPTGRLRLSSAMTLLRHSAPTCYKPPDAHLFESPSRHAKRFGLSRGFMVVALSRGAGVLSLFSVRGTSPADLCFH